MIARTIIINNEHYLDKFCLDNSLYKFWYYYPSETVKKRQEQKQSARGEEQFSSFFSIPN